jgi:hypothetical protein
VLDHDELLFEFRRDLYDRRKNYHKRALLLAGRDLMGQSLDDFGRLQKPMKVHEHQECRTFRLG